MKRMALVTSAFAATLFVPNLLPPGYAQETTATVVGTVSDSTGAVLPDVTLAVTNLATNARRETRTDTSGNYSIPLLPVGDYTLTATLKGFKTQRVDHLTLQVQQTTRVDLQLPIGDVTETIQVVASGAALQTENATVGTVIDSSKILDLPLNGRNFVQLAQLIPGVESGTPGSMTVRRGRGSMGQNDPAGGSTGMSANGSRDTQNRYYIDGVELMDYDGMTYPFSPSVDSLAEFKVETSTYSAESGGAPGGQINMITKHGTNQFHGTLWEFNRNDALSQSRDAIAGIGAIPPRLNRNQFGANVGGPVYLPHLYQGRDKTFFFFNWESGRLLQGSVPESKLVPTVAQRAGDFSGLVNASTGKCFQLKDPFNAGIDTTPTANGCFRNQIPTAALSPQALTFMQSQFEPLPNTTPVTKANGVLVSDYSTPRGSAEPTQNNYNARVDHNFSPKDVLYGRYIFNSTYEASLPVWGHDTRNNLGRDQNAVLSHVHTFSPGVINEARLGWNRFTEREIFGTSDDPAFDVAGKMNLSGISRLPSEFGPPNISIKGADGTYDAYNLQRQIGPRDRSNSIYQFGETLMWQHGSHFLKFGAEIDRRRATFKQARAPRGQFSFDGTYTGSALADFMLGYVRSAIVNAGHTSTNLSNFWHAYFVNDDWKLSSRLTINAGLRYDYFQPYTQSDDKYGTIEQVGFVIPPNARVITPSNSQFGRGLIAPDRKNFGPRMGFAWRPGFLGNDSVVRAGYGIYYTPDLSNAFFEGMSEGFQATGVNLSNGNAGNAIFFNQDFTKGSSGQFPFMASIDPNLKSTYVQQWNLNLQHKLPGSIVLDLGYVGSKGTRLNVTFNDFNRPITPINFDPSQKPAPPSVNSRRPNQTFLRAVTGEKSVGNSIYHALQVKAERRLSRGLMFLTAYTYAKAISGPSDIGGLVGGGFFIGSPQDIFNLKADRSVSGFDQTHRFVQTVVYDLPFFRNAQSMTGRLLGGWQASSILTLQSGFPAGINVSGPNDTTGTGVASRADLLAGQSGNLPGNQRTFQHWFNTAAFAPVPANAARFGTAPRTDAIRMPGAENVDFSVAKQFRFRESRSVEFRAEAFNLFDHFNPSFVAASANQSVVGASSNLDVRSASFGQINDGTKNGITTRVIQLGLKLYF